MFYQLNNTRAVRLKAGLEPATIYNILNFSVSVKGCGTLTDNFHFSK